MRSEPTIDHENGFNHEILSRLDLPLGEPTPELVAYFDQCVSVLHEAPRGKGFLKGYPVYADPDSGVILAAVCGAAGVALRLPQAWRDELLAAGGKDHLTYGTKGITLGNRFGGESAGWIVTDGGLKIDRVREGLSAMQITLRAARKALIAAKAQPNPVKPEDPINKVIIHYLRDLHPDAPIFGGGNLGYGSYLGLHPDIPDFVWVELPERANIAPVGWIVHGTLTLVHPRNGLIFAFYKNEEVFGLWMPTPHRTEAMQSVSPGNARVHLYPEVGEDWIRFDPFAFTEQGPKWLAYSYNLIGLR